MKSSRSTSKTNTRRLLGIILAGTFSFALAVAVYLRISPAGGRVEMVEAQNFSGPTRGASASPALPHVPGRVILKIKPDYRALCLPARINIPELELAFTAAHVSRLGRAFPRAEYRPGTNALGQPYIDLSTIYELHADSSLDVAAFAQLLSRHPAVQYAEPRWISEVLYEPNDFYYQYQWYADSIYVHDAWDLTKGDTSIAIGIIDTGTEFAHEDLGGDRVAFNRGDTIDGVDNDSDGFIDNYRGWDFTGAAWSGLPDNDPSYVGSGPGMDHGVLVTGVACARPDNGKGIAGMGYNTRYIPLKAGPDASISISHGYDAIVYAADRGIKILNLSWGSAGYSQFSQDAVNYAAVNHNCLLVAAAGNQHVEQLVYPASYDHVISVAGIAPGDRVWTSGNGNGTTFNPLVDISAFGQNLMTTTGGSGYWGGSTGTSMAAPLVCATAALVMAANPTYNALQAGEAVRVSALPHYNRNAEPQYQERLGLGRLHAGRALTLSGLTSIRVDSLALQDGNNNIAEGFDTIRVRPSMINYLSAISGATITIGSTDPGLIEVIQGTASLPAMATNTKAATSTDFVIRIKKEVTEARTVYLRFGMSSGSYTDYQYVLFEVRPLRIDLTANTLKTTLTGQCAFGYTDIPYCFDGLGMQAGPVMPILRDGALLIAQPSTGKLLSGGQNEFGTRGSDLRGVQFPQKRTSASPGAVEWVSYHADDSAGTNRMGLEVTQHIYQDPAAGRSEYIIVEYIIRNKSAGVLNGLQAGMQAAWDGTWASIDQARYVAGAKAMTARFARDGQRRNAGVSLLSDGPVRGAINQTISYDFSRSSKLTALAGSPSSSTSNWTQVIQTIGTAPFDLQPGQVRRVAFAWVMGNDSTQLRLNANAARSQYHCLILGESPQVSLPADTTTCQGNAVVLQATGGTQYAWSNGATTASISVTDPGTYAVTVTNSYGCSSIAQVQVQVTDLLADHSMVLPANPQLQTMLPFSIEDIDGVLSSVTWDFGDGITGIGNPLMHLYSASGTYTVTATISDGTCTSTFSEQLRIEGTNAIAVKDDEDWRVYPNPTRGPLSISMPGSQSGTLTLTNLQGQQVMREKVNGFIGDDYNLDLSILPAATYVLRWDDGERVRTRKVVKK